VEHCGIDLHLKSSEVSLLDEAGAVSERARIPTTETSFRRWFGGREGMRICIEASGLSPWVARLLRDLGHEVIVANAQRVRLIAESTLKNDKVDAETLARLVRMDPALLCPIRHRSEETQRLRIGTRYPIPFIRGANTDITISPLWWRPDCFPRHCFAIGLSCPPIASDRYDHHTSPKWVTTSGPSASRFPAEDVGHVSPSPFWSDEQQFPESLGGQGPGTAGTRRREHDNDLYSCPKPCWRTWCSQPPRAPVKARRTPR
jgi:hypothetical protein